MILLFKRSLHEQTPREPLESIIDRMERTDLIISDLDDTDTYSPAKRIAYSYLARPDKLSSPKFWTWAIPCFFDLMINGQDAEEGQWKKFRESFLSDPEELNYQVMNHLGHAKSRAFPGLLDFYDNFPSAKKAYISRNIPEIAEAYGAVYGFDKIVSNAFDREEAVRSVLDEFPNKRNVLFKGDAKSDEDILRILKEYKSSGRINSLVSINVANGWRRIHPDFDLTINRDYTALVEILQRRAAKQVVPLQSKLAEATIKYGAKLY